MKMSDVSCLRLFRLIPVVLLIFLIPVFADWPTYNYDNARSAGTCESLPLPLAEHWRFHPGAGPMPAWSDPPAEPEPEEGNLELPRLNFDNAFYVVADAGAVYFASSGDHHVYCLDSATGNVRWTFCTDGPVRLAPTLWQGHVYVGSDDGYVYCLDDKNGSVKWKFRAAPYAEKILGNGRLISRWPVRTSVLIADGKAYFAAGVFPGEGVYIYALDAVEGTIVWRSDAGHGDQQESQGVISPQGYLLADDNLLVVPLLRATRPAATFIESASSP